MRTAFRNTLDEITRIQKGPPPVLPLPFMLDTMVTRAWVNDPIHDDVAPMEHHVIAPTLHGDGYSEVRFGTKTIRNPSLTGRVTIAPRGFGGRFHCDGKPTASNIFISKERLQHCADMMGFGRLPELIPTLNSEDPKLFAILALITSEAETCSAHSRLYIDTLVDLLCFHLLRDHAAFEAPEFDVRSRLLSRQLSRVNDYMHDHLDEAIGLQQLADLLGISRFHLCKAFRKATGFSPHQWLVRMRMQHARELLLDDRMTVTEIALAVGYQTPSSFAQAFRAAVGTSPSEYRQSQR